MQSKVLHQKISAYIQQYRNDIIKDIKRLVDIESVRTEGGEGAPFGSGFARALDEAKKIGADMGFVVQDYDGYCASLSTGPTQREIGFFAHLDVVPAFDGWTYPPFNTTEMGDYLIGRGTLDDKGPTVIVMYAMKCLRDLGLLKRHGVKLVMGCNEGCGIDGLQKYKEKAERLPDFSIVADSTFPVCYAEKGCISFTIKHPLNSGRLISLSSGNASNMVPGYACAQIRDMGLEEIREILKDYPVTVEEADGAVTVSAAGIPGHVANPEGSVNAIGVLFFALHDSGILKDDAAPFCSAAQYIRDYYGYGLGIQAEDTTTGRLTHAACMTWITEDNQLAMSFNIRYPVCITSEKIMDTVTALLYLDGFTIYDVDIVEPIYTPPSNEVIVALTDLYNKVAGDDARPFYEGKMSYAHSLPNAIAYGPIFPNAPSPFEDQRGRDHTPDECININNILKAIEIYVMAVLELDDILMPDGNVSNDNTSSRQTVGDIIGQDGLKDAKVVAGRRKLNNVISSISVLEVTEAAVGKWVVPNQLYLTAFYAIRDNIPMQKVVIKTLASSGCSGLILCHVGHWMHMLSHEIVNLCEELGLPLIVANPDTSYASIMEPILRKLMWPDTKANTISQSAKIRNDILEIAALEEIPSTMLQRISELEKLKCTYLDIYYKCIYTDKTRSVLEQEIHYIRNNASEISRDSINGMYYIWNNQGYTKVIAPIRTTSNFFGYIVLDVDMENKNWDNKYIIDLISSLTVVCVMGFSRRGRLDEMQEKYVSEYITDLLAWNFHSEEAAIRRGKEVGINIQNKHEVIAVSFSVINPKSDLNLGGNLRSYVQKTYLPMLEELLYYYNPDAAFIYRNDLIAILWGSSNSVLDIKKAAQAIVQLFEEDKNISAYVGISRYYSKISELSHAYMEASNTASLCRILKCENKMATWLEMWLFSSIQQQIMSQNSKELFEQMLAPLKSYDNQHDSCLLETLAVLVRCDMDIVKASAKLYIHRNTLLYRKNKIVELLGYSPFEMPYFLNFYTAFQFLFKDLEF